MDGFFSAVQWMDASQDTDVGAVQVYTQYLKQQVGEGLEFGNEVVRAVLSQRGCYYQFVELPEEFSAALGEFSYRFVGWREALGLLDRLYRLPTTDFWARTVEFSILVVYDRFDGLSEQSIYAYHYERSSESRWNRVVTRGRFRPAQLPRFFKVRLVAHRILEGLDFSSGMAFFIANPGESHLLVQVPYPASTAVDLLMPHQMH